MPIRSVTRGKKKKKLNYVRSTILDEQLHKGISCRNRFDGLQQEERELTTVKEGAATILNNSMNVVAEKAAGEKRLQFFRKLKEAKSLAPVESKKDEKKQGWTCMSIAVDSGACDSVLGPKSIPQYEDQIKETDASLKGEGYVSATGEEIPNYGELHLPVITRERALKKIVFQAAGVAKPLLSAEQLNLAGNVVIFDGDESCIVNKGTFEVSALRREEGNFMLDVWVPPPGWAELSGFGRRP